MNQKRLTGIFIQAGRADLAECTALSRLAASPPSLVAQGRPPGRQVNRINAHQSRL
jgi:hypothetical protein